MPTSDQTEAIDATVGELRAFLASELPDHRRAFPDDRSFPSRVAWQRRLADARWAALSWPRELGGRALSIAQRLRCELEMALADAPQLAGQLGVYNVGPTLIAWGTDEQRSHLPKINRAEEIWCQGFSEPDAGSDLAGLRTSAVPAGDGFVVSGRKVWTTNGMEASHCLLLARTDPDAPKHKGISAFLVPLDLPGIERRPIVQMDGGRDFAEMTFDGVRVERSWLLGPLNDGWTVTMTTLSHERAGVISQAALLERDVTRALESVRGTVDPVLRDDLARRFIEGRVLGMLGARALTELSRGGQPGPQHSIIRLSQGLLRQRLAETRARASGPAAVAWPPDAPDPVGREVLTSRSSTIAAGTREVLKNVVAERVLGLPRA
jgi:alkylation response protein AidB-like acyl-CoA dehydrogenase